MAGEHYYSERPTSRLRLGLVRCRIQGQGYEFLTASGIFSHRRIDPGTGLLIESMVLPEEGSALDLGCGYGPVGIVAARLRPGLEVWMTDVNPRAVEFAEENARRNGVGNVRVLRGNLYEPVGDKLFDVVLTNPPISAGIERVVEPLIEGAFSHLVGGGSLQLVVQSSKGGRTLASSMERYFGDAEVLARGGGYRVLMATKK